MDTPKPATKPESEDDEPEKEEAEEPKEQQKKAAPSKPAVAPTPAKPAADEPAEPTELPCNVFGTVDRCDGMICEHDGNCFSGCCALFVAGE